MVGAFRCKYAVMRAKYLHAPSCRFVYSILPSGLKIATRRGGKTLSRSKAAFNINAEEKVDVSCDVSKNPATAGL
jgi:hypothetical protein